MAVIALARARSPAAAEAPAAGGARLRVGLFLSGRVQPRALAEAFADIARSDYAQIVLVALAPPPAAGLSPAWRLYRRLDRWAFSRRATAAADVDLVASLAPVPVLELAQGCDGFPALKPRHAEIAALRLDVAFVLGDFDEQLLAGAARYGAWRLAFGLVPEDARGREGFREVLEGQPLTHAGISVVRPGRSERLLCASCSRTAPFSATRNRNKLLRRAAQFPARLLRQVHLRGEAALDAPSAAGRIPAAAPAALRLPQRLADLGERIATRALQKLLYVDQWFLAWRFSRNAGEAPGSGRFRCLLPPKDRFWADPFPLERNGRHYIFFEELVFAEKKAHIAVVEVDADGACSPPQRVLERPYHLSYPFLIEDGGRLYMVPESGANGSVELYRCVHFPDRWALEKVLLRAPCAADASFHRVDGRWWMFVNLGVDEADVHDELHLYYADSLFGEWRPHRRNPVKSDVRSARSAGRPFERNGRLYRPAQIGAPIYGAGISINEVLTLTPEAYAEREVERCVPAGAGRVLGLHTVNRAGSLCVVDGFLRRKRWRDERIDFIEPARLGPDGIPDANNLQGECA